MDINFLKIKELEDKNINLENMLNKASKEAINWQKRFERERKARKEAEYLLEQKARELDEERTFINSLMNSQSNIVISTDGKKLQTANKAFLDFFYIKSINEFFEKYGQCICDTFIEHETSPEYLTKQIGDLTWLEYITLNSYTTHKAKIFQNNKLFTFTVSSNQLTFKNKIISVVVLNDITALEESRKDSDNLVIFMKQLLDSIPHPIFYKNEEGRFIGFNKAYEHVFAIDSKYLLGKTVMDLDYLPLSDRLIYNDEDMNVIRTKTRLEREQNMLFSDNKIHNTIYSVNSFTKQDGTSGGLIGIFTDITPLEEARKEIEAVHKNIKDSINYASLIQSSLIPNNYIFDKFFIDHFSIWQPKDIVGGDIYLVEALNENELLIIIADCTGHGVPGAFVTMLVKAIERQIVSRIINNKEAVSPSHLLSVFYRSIKHLLNQNDNFSDNSHSKSNVGFDGAILHFNKNTKTLKFAGANTNLFYLETANNSELKIIKADRHSIGYRKSDSNFKFNEHILNITEETQFFITTDGYIDQNGGEKDLPFGKNRFSKIIKDNLNKNCKIQKDVFIEQFNIYKGSQSQTDDVTLISFKI